MGSSEYFISVTVSFIGTEMYNSPNLVPGELPISQQPAESYSMFDQYYSKLQAWNPAFERFMTAKSRFLGGKELRGAAVLKIHSLIVKVMAEASPGLLDDRPIGEVMNDQATFEPFTEDFRIVVTLCKSIIAAAEEAIKAGKPALNFSTDLGIVGPLYYVCARCRDIPLRNEALELLTRCPRLEGMWSSEVAARMVKEYWEIESRHIAFQNDTVAELGVNIPLCEVVDLVFTDGNKWEVWTTGSLLFYDSCNTPFSACALLILPTEAHFTHFTHLTLSIPKTMGI